MFKSYLFKLIFIVLLGCSTGISFADKQKTDYAAISNKINNLMRQYHYNPAELISPEYMAMEFKTKMLGSRATSDDEFINSFNDIWRSGPFSHVRLQKAQQPVVAMAKYLDELRVGDGATTLRMNDDYAVMTIYTMMGADTIERISAYYQQITEAGVDNLIIDLRNNDGGAFAVKPLVGHLLTKAVDVGVFVSQPWNAKNRKPPTLAQTQQTKPWTGWSLTSFWADVQKNNLTRIQMTPMAPHFQGKVYVLTSKKTASAAELATDALAYLENVTIIGEKTEGAMLSQTMFDVASGIHLFLPIADYYSHRMGRIEGAGVKPDIQVKAYAAMDKAVSLIND